MGTNVICVLHHPWKKPSKCPSKHSAWIDPVVVQQFWEKRCETISGGSFLALLSGGGIGCQIIPSKISGIHQHWASSDNGNDHERATSNYSVSLLWIKEPTILRAKKTLESTFHFLNICTGLSFSSDSVKTKASHQNINNNKIDKKSYRALSCHTFGRRFPFFYNLPSPTKNYVGSISLLSLAQFSLSNCPHVSSIYSTATVDNQPWLIECQRENVSLKKTFTVNS